MIKVKHPDEKYNRSQEEMLAASPPDQRRFHELIFTVGNITYRYHQRSKDFRPTQEEYEEWLEGLAEDIRIKTQGLGFEQCKTILSFTRYVMEKNDIGLQEYIRQHMDHEDYKEYLSLTDND
jgi:hypothetical protein